MIRPIMKNIDFLKIPSVDLKTNELYVVDDLVHTLSFHQSHCVGMAANMIGYSKNVIVVLLNNKEILPMINPKILNKKDLYHTEEGCLSLDGVRPADRYRKITVEYFDKSFKKKTKTFIDFEAQIVQHEIDHLFGIII